MAKLVRMATKKGEKRARRSDGYPTKTDGEITRRIAHRVKVLREAAGWSQNELERRADVGVATVTRLEGAIHGGKDHAKIIGIDTLVRISEALAAPLDFLVYGKVIQHSQQLPLFSGDVPDVWATAPGGTRRARLLVTERPARGVVRPPKSAVERPAPRTSRKPAKKRDP